jgi:hypothetical protein
MHTNLTMIGTQTNTDDEILHNLIHPIITKMTQAALGHLACLSMRIGTIGCRYKNRRSISGGLMALTT